MASQPSRRSLFAHKATHPITQLDYRLKIVLPRFRPGTAIHAMSA
jgi:hypothetical protein